MPPSAPSRQRPAAAPRSRPLTQRDQELLEALAEHRIVLLDQVAAWLGVAPSTAARRLRRLAASGLVEHRRLFDGSSPMARITAAGLRQVDSPLGAPGQKLDEYRHDVGVAWVWTAARAGAFGELATIVTERTLRSHDTRIDRLRERGRPLEGGLDVLGVGRGLWRPDGRLERHYPDLVLETAAGHRVAVELELSIKSAKRLDRVMEAYRSDPRIDGVLYLAGTARVAARVREAADRWGMGDRVAVRRIAEGRVGGVDPAPTRVRDRSRAREVTR